MLGLAGHRGGDAAGAAPRRSATRARRSTCSANRVVLEVAGPAARDVLATCCPLDLHPRAFGPDRCAGTLLGTAQVLSSRRRTSPLPAPVRPSFLAYAVDWLVAGVEGVRAVAGER